MKRVFLLLLVRCFLAESQQSNHNSYEGWWQGDMLIKAPYANLKNTFIFVRNNKICKLNLEDKKVFCSYYLFQTYSESPQKLFGISYDTLNKKYLCENCIGKSYYSEVGINDKYFNYFVDVNFSCDKTTLLYFYGEYKKINDLPNEVVNFLLNQSKKDNINYLKDYLGLTFRNILSVKAVVYSKPTIATKMYLLKGDGVEILQVKKDWVQIRFYGKKTIEGWIKKSDLE